MSIARSWFRAWSVLCATGLLVCVAPSAQAHTRMDMPPARDMQDGYKPTRSPGFVLPCGIARSAAQPVTKLDAGSTIAMKWTETIYHPGCFIIDFAPTDTGPATVFNRLQIEPHAAGTGTPRAYQVQVKLPSEPCTNCILRVRQYMLGGTPCPPTSLQDNNANLYYSCANVVLQAGGGGGDAGADAAKDAPSSSIDAGSGGTSGSGSGGAAVSTGGASGSGGAITSTGGASGSGGTMGGAGGTTTGPGPSESSGGCSVAGAPALSALPLLAAALILIRRRRQS